MTKRLLFGKMKLMMVGVEVSMVLSGKVKLTAKDILEKDFKTSMRGYKQEEVDRFLDIIIKDYEAMHQIIEELQQENIRLKKLVEETEKKPAPQTAGTTNFDILKRLSNLEKHVFGSKLHE